MPTPNLDHLDPSELAEFRRCANEFQAGVIHAVLEDAGIPSQVTSTERTLPGVFGLTGSSEAAVIVRHADLDRAEAALQSRRQESVDLDWDEVDVGEPADPLARRIAGGPLRRRRDWWRAGWKAAIILAIAAIIVGPFKTDAALVLVLAAGFAGLGSAGSWLLSRVRTPGATEAPAPPRPSSR